MRITTSTLSFLAALAAIGALAATAAVADPLPPDTTYRAPRVMQHLELAKTLHAELTGAKPRPAATAP